jgi:hypothetical protein
MFSKAVGRPLKIVFVHAPRARTEGPVAGGHLVRAAQEEFGAKPVRGTPREGGQDG